MGTKFITTKMIVELFMMILGLTAVAIAIVYIPGFRTNQNLIDQKIYQKYF